MPRSLADRFERASMTGRSSLAGGRSDVISVGSAATRHWVNSVSDIYGPDEIEELLEDLNRLEMASYDGLMTLDDEYVSYHVRSSEDARPGDERGVEGAHSRLEFGHGFDGPGGGYTNDMLGIMGHEAVISGCITQPPDDDLEDFDIDGSQVTNQQQQQHHQQRQRQRRQQFDGGGGSAMGQPHQPPQQPHPPSALARRSSHSRFGHTRRGSSTWSVRSWDSHAHYPDFRDLEADDAQDDDGLEGSHDGPGGLFPSTGSGH